MTTGNAQPDDHGVDALLPAAIALKAEAVGVQKSGLDALMEYVHLHVAVPDVAGHPTGGAIDLTLADENDALDMGSAYGDFSTPLYHAFAEGTTEAQRANRMLLRQVMVEAGFAPFTGEWWHFSCGDREWAAIWDQPAALYEQLEEPGTEASPHTG